MNETTAAQTTDETQTAAVTEVTKPEKKAKAKAKPKTKPAKKKVKATVAAATKAKPKASTGITGTQYRVLKACVKKPLTRKALSTDEFNGNSINFVPILTPLIEAKLLKQQDLDVDGAKEIVFQTTALGKKVVDKGPPATTRTANHESIPATIKKTYLGKDYEVKHKGGKFYLGGKEYTSLTAVAKVIRKSDQEVNGWAFFALVKKPAA